MSRLMAKLKKVEHNLSKSPQTLSSSGTSHSVKNKNNHYKTKLTAVMIVLCAIFVGVLGYFAGFQSGKGGSGITKSDDTSKTVDNNSASLSKKYLDDLEYIAFNEDEPVPEIPPLPMETSSSVSSDIAIAKNIGTPFSNEPAGGSSSGDSSKIAILTSAINKTAEMPLTPEEEEKNKQTLNKLNVLGVVKDEHGMVAIISGKEIREGDKIRQFVVDEISTDYILLSFKRNIYKKLVR